MMNDNVNFSHAIMFHHFHGGKHLPSQGSLSARDFSEMLDWLGNRYNLIGAQKYLEKFENCLLADDDICLSFDDALLCQYDIALPILTKYNLDAFFFVYSSAFTANPDKLEIFRHFRTNNFMHIEDFYQHFFAIAEKELEGELGQHIKVFENKDYLGAFPFYSKNDKLFRYLRDQVFGPDRYQKIMLWMMSERDFSPQDIAHGIWMSKNNLKDLAKDGHIIGLHSYDHPTQMSKLSFDEQYHQYSKNYSHLRSVVGNVVSMSHPCGDYNSDTLNILESLELKIGFRSCLSEKKSLRKFEMPREDHANILKKMKNKD